MNEVGIRTKEEKIADRIEYCKERLQDLKEDLKDAANTYGVEFDEFNHTIDDAVFNINKKRGTARIRKFVNEMYVSYKVYEHELFVLEVIQTYD